MVSGSMTRYFYFMKYYETVKKKKTALCLGLPRCLMGKESTCQCSRCEILDLRRSPREGNANTLQYSCLKILWTEELGRLQSVGS